MADPNSPAELCFAVAPEADGWALRDFLRAAGVSATLVKAVKKQGGFWVGDTPLRTCDVVRAGQSVRFCLPPEPPTSVQPQAIPLAIAYESRHVLVLEKPAGMAVHPTLNYHSGTLANAYMGLLQARGEAGVFRPVNRIDKDTSGLVLCAKNAWAAALLAGSARKVYRAILEGAPSPEQGRIEAPIARAPGSIILRRVWPGGKPSCTEYAAERRAGEYTLVRAAPITGRTHQLRVHFAHIGCPLAGDELYGGSRAGIARQALHCDEISFAEPGGTERKTVTSPLPPDMAALLESVKER